jgi:RHS repeat-associated protein
LGHKFNLTYDTKGNLTKLSDPLGNAYNITYDGQGKPLNITNPVSKVTKLAWDGADLSTVTDALNRVMQYRTDGAGRVQSITDPLGNRTLQYWDALNQMETMAFDAVGQLKQRIDRKGQLSSVTFDALSRTKRIGFGATAAAPTVFKSVVELSWDAANRLAQVLDKTCTNPTTSLNCATVGSTQTTTLTYDNLVRLIKEVTPQGEVNYTYDTADRRVSMTVKNGAPAAQTAQPALCYTWDNASRLPQQWGGKTFSYDPNGNLIADGTSTYQWDERNQLKGVSTGATGLANFQYDAFGRRSGKTVGGTTTGFLYDGDNFVQELSGTANTSAVKAQLITGGIDEIFLREEGINLQSVMADANNNTIRILDKNQAKVVDYSYEAYGKTTADATNTNNQQYTGRENDNPGNDNGLYFYRARYYMPRCARFISEYPIGWASGQTNNYSYVGSNPVSYGDSYGLSQCDIDIAVDIISKAYPDLNMGSGPPVPDVSPCRRGPNGAPLEGEAHIDPGQDGRIHINSDFRDKPIKSGYRFLNVIIHEALHFTRSYKINSRLIRIMNT